VAAEVSRAAHSVSHRMGWSVASAERLSAPM